MSKKNLNAPKGMLGCDETEEQFSIRIREDAKKKLLLNRPEFNEDAIQAAMSLSMLSSHFGDLTKKPYNTD